MKSTALIFVGLAGFFISAAAVAKPGDGEFKWMPFSENSDQFGTKIYQTTFEQDDPDNEHYQFVSIDCADAASGMHVTFMLSNIDDGANKYDNDAVKNLPKVLKAYSDVTITIDKKTHKFENAILERDQPYLNVTSKDIDSSDVEYGGIIKDIAEASAITVDVGHFKQEMEMRSGKDEVLDLVEKCKSIPAPN